MISFVRWYKIEIQKYVKGKRIDRPTSEEWIRLRDKEK